MAVQIQTRNGTAAQWTSANPTLAVGEMGFETDTKKFKFGDGSTAWNSLGYASSTGTVTSVGQSFTGGIVSVTGSPVTSSGTLALTVAGTSGGVPYFSSGTTWASSAALASNALVVGGGSGLAPSTITTGTGVVTALGVTTNAASGIVVKDANGNITTNATFNGFTSVAASGTTITLTAASTPVYSVTGSGGQVIQLPNATTLPNGTIFSFNNNQSSGAITVNNASSTLVVSIPSGGYVTVVLLSNATSAGSWDRHDQTPSNTSWSTNTLDYPGSITSATWNGTAVAVNRGGTGQTTTTAAINALLPTQATNSGKYLTTDGTNTSWATVSGGGSPGGSTTQVQFNNAGAFGGSANFTWDGTNAQLGATGALRFADSDSSNYVAFKSPATVASNVTWTLPSTDGTTGQVLSTNGSGVLSWVTASTPTAPTSVEYLIVGGGGGSAAAGGGGGGYRTSASASVTSGVAYTVTVGAGGAGGATSSQGSSSSIVGGSSSPFQSPGIVSAGGGKGADSNDSPGGNGGSGGGAFNGGGGGAGQTGGSGNTPSTSPSQGNNGGNSVTATGTSNGGGGGGAGAVGGSSASSSQGGNGGNGTASSITGTSVTYAGGGGGGSGGGGGTTGGTGGGGNGGGINAGTNGTANTGGGGGAGFTAGFAALNGGSGGSGVVIIRYADTYSAASATTGSPTITVAGGYRVYTWTGSGSITF